MEINFVNDFKKIYNFEKKIDKGKYGMVSKCSLINSTDKIYYACKIVKRKNDYLRELDHLLKCKNCLGIIQLEKIFFNKKYLLFQFPLGESFEKKIETKTFESTFLHLQYCLKIIIELLQNINEIHNLNIVHRDIKPSNFIILNEKITLIDFGFSKIILNKDLIPNYDLVTPLYRSPELYRITNENYYNHLIDEWSLGCILYECFSGKTPFESDNIIKIKKKISSYIWWRNGNKNCLCNKNPYNLYKKLKKYLNLFFTYELNSKKIILKQEETYHYFNIITNIIENLLNPNLLTRYSSKKILKNLGIELSNDFNINLNNNFNNDFNIIDLNIYQDLLFEYYLFCKEIKILSPCIFYHTLKIWNQYLIQLNKKENEIYLLYASFKISCSYYGFHDKILNKILNKSELSLKKIDYFFIKILNVLNGKIWMDDSDLSFKKWNDNREKENLIKFIINEKKFI